MKDRKAFILAVLNLVALAGTLVVNYLANALPLNGYQTGTISDLYPNLFVPAGFTFSIWGIIYLLLSCFVIFTIIRSAGEQNKEREFIHKIGILFLIVSAANIGWIITWHYLLLWASLCLILAMLFLLIAIYMKLDIRKRGMKWRERILVALPFSIYLGWISVATAANITAYLVAAGWGGYGLSQEFWLLIVLVAVTGITVAVIHTRQDPYFAAVILWALFGIGIKRFRVDGNTLPVPVVGVCMLIILVNITFKVFKKEVY